MMARQKENQQRVSNRAARVGRLRQRRLQAAGLERLIAVLEHAASEASGEPIPGAKICPERPSRVARLYAAHSAYALASSPMRRVSVNGWIRHGSTEEPDLRH